MLNLYLIGCYKLVRTAQRRRVLRLRLRRLRRLLIPRTLRVCFPTRRTTPAPLRRVERIMRRTFIFLIWLDILSFQWRWRGCNLNEAPADFLFILIGAGSTIIRRYRRTHGRSRCRTVDCMGIFLYSATISGPGS